ncbi:MAG: NAD+ synthase [Bacteroidetes bacterium]|nr:NAD+ synthase [Bacteroidota bacterium]
MKIALAQINYHIGNFESNTSKIIAAIENARSAGADLVVFAELAVSGYPPRDFLEFNDFIERCLHSVDKIAEHCRGIAAIVGSPTRRAEIKGKDLHNSALFLSDGKIQAMAHKSLLPNYDVFDEYRYFEPYREFEVIHYKGKKIALTICEDIWDIGEDPLYTINPMDELMKQLPDMMINIAASPFHYEQARSRKEVILSNVRKYKLPLFYVNHVGAQTELLFDGGSLVASPEGFVVDELNYFEEDFRIYELEDVEEAVMPEGGNPLGLINDKIALIHDALLMGIRNYFGKLGFTKAILGLSGGIDSAVTMVLAARALGPEHVRAVLLPSAFSSEHSVNDALQLAQNLGSPYDLISIEEAFDSLDHTLQPIFGDLPFDITEENMQARIRAVILMAMSNKLGHILLNTSNKSEAAVGYSTLYGDMSGGISVLGDVYKTDVFELARYINKDGEVIPENTIIKPPSAELRPDQKDSDSLPEYEILDKILYQYIERRKGPKELVSMGFEKNIVDRILKLVNTSEFKRFQTPPVLRVSTKAFGMGRRLPIVGKYLS